MQNNRKKKDRSPLLVFEKMAIYLHGEVQPQRKSRRFFNARALMAREIMRSRDAQCNTGEWP